MMKTLTKEEIQKFHRIVWWKVYDHYKSHCGESLDISQVKKIVLHEMGIPDDLFSCDCLCCEVANAHQGCVSCPLDIWDICDDGLLFYGDNLSFYEVLEELIEIINVPINKDTEIDEYRVPDEVYNAVLAVI